MVNSELAKIFREMAVYLEMEGVAFKPQAYEKAAYGLESCIENVKDVYEKGGTDALQKISGVGKGIAEHIEEFLKNGHIKGYDQLKKHTPVDVAGLTAIEGVGPKAVKKLYEKLKIKTVDDLEKAAKEGKIRELEGFGEKSEAKILKGIEFLRTSGGRAVLGLVAGQVESVAAKIRALKEVNQLVVAGSYRRRKETIGDIDVLVVSHNPEKVMDFFVKMPEVAHVYAHGPTKTMVKLKNGLDMDMRVVEAHSFGAALNYFTGSKEHNVHLRQIAIKKGLKLNEYGLFKGTKQIAGKTEEDLYKTLGLRYMEPELRENTGEIELSAKGKLPDIIEYGSLKGDLQVQTNWTDGEHSIEEMTEAAIAMGLEYIAITDHTKALAMTGGADERKLIEQMKYIDNLNSKFKIQNSKFRILKGAEVNIMKDGSLDIADEVLEKLDVVGAAVHSHFTLPAKEQTARVVRAIENPHVDIFFHPTARVINRRPPIELDMEEVIAVAKKTGTVLEIDAYPDRSDLKDEYIKKAVESGVKLAIDSDAHNKVHYQFLEYGIAQARRGWACKEDIINTKPVVDMLKLLKH